MQTPITCFTTTTNQRIIPIYPIKKIDYPAWFATLPLTEQTWLQNLGINADTTKPCLIPNAEGHIAKVICLAEQFTSRWSFAAINAQLPAGDYEFMDLTAHEYQLAAIGWGLAAYRFTPYKSQTTLREVKLVLPEAIDIAAIIAEVTATYLVRDLINTPAEDMGPEQLGQIAEQLAQQYDGSLQQIIGDDLLAANFPAIHRVGRGSKLTPRLIDMSFGAANAPKITLIGKGVCFDSGGLNLKGGSNMRLMKKDMGGAATVLGLAQWILALALPIRLRVLIPAVENMVSGNAYRPGDVIKTRKGLQIEIGNTDAEGRVILADALALACEDNPDLIIDYATLTGAARVGLGPEIPNLFSNNATLAQTLQTLSAEQDDLCWHMPLYRPYREFIDSSIADISNDSSIAQGGALTAALFLNEFVTPNTAWVHLDMNGWNNKARPGRPEGGEAMGMRMVCAYLASKK